MSNLITSNSQGVKPVVIPPYKKGRLNGFRRLQLALAWWGLLLVIAGWLHNTYNSAWSFELVLTMWLGVTGLGLAGNYLLAPRFLNSGMLFMWSAVIAIGFLITLIVHYPLDGTFWPLLSITWHAVLALGYLLNGYFSDRRLWWLAGWELFMALVMIYVGLNPPSNPAKSLSTGGTPLQIGGFVFYGNQGLLLGLASGIPLIIAALPIWKERYSRG
jgi:hypothetical protein